MALETENLSLKFGSATTDDFRKMFIPPTEPRASQLSNRVGPYLLLAFSLGSMESKYVTQSAPDLVLSKCIIHGTQGCVIQRL